MRAACFILMLLFAGLVAGCGAKPEPATGDKGSVESPKSDLDRIQGVWSVEAIDLGREIPQADKDSMKSLRFHFDAGKLTKLHRPDRPGHTSTFKLDSAKEPKTIDMEDEEDRVSGIYKFEEGFLILAVANSGGPRPTEFKALALDEKAKERRAVWTVKLKKTDEKPIAAPPPRVGPTHLDTKGLKK